MAALSERKRCLFTTCKCCFSQDWLTSFGIPLHVKQLNNLKPLETQGYIAFGYQEGLQDAPVSKNSYRHLVALLLRNSGDHIVEEVIGTLGAQSRGGGHQQTTEYIKLPI
jgi:hypothetical protein